MPTYRLTDHVLRAGLANEEVLLNTERSHYHLLNATGRRVFALLEEGCDIDGVVAQICADTDATESTVRADVERFVVEATERGLIEESSE